MIVCLCYIFIALWKLYFIHCFDLVNVKEFLISLKILEIIFTLFMKFFLWCSIWIWKYTCLYICYTLYIYTTSLMLNYYSLFCCLKNVSKSYWITVNVTVIYFLYILQDRFVSINHILWALQNMCKRIDMREKVLANFIF